ncbi:2-aminoethylphosphonate--pyruvate transaminase [Telmatospirillum siberiense]|uniref:2-aminoethylphosphonate--pyruvate transaminase n=1 Tax=Telmatospirillum siberiense TaxID=382514 RepID=A0A2N3PZA9_9PROT|nr:2-aminoethylphosphonate--pyruvate transaminase [Telmatospirillum siberiense]PKU25754.1 2-aminoethylphosphonate--pyruvate transaminase [Telmatospirillum siberiense]
MTRVVPILLTPGPLTTRLETRQAMLRDWGSRDDSFIAMTAEIRQRLLAVAGGGDRHVAVPLQGSGTFIVEAAIGTLLGPNDKLLVLINGAYGERILTIAQRLGRRALALRWPENQAVEPDLLEQTLRETPDITHVALVHCETTTGLENPLGAIAAITARHGKAFLVDAMSSFGALKIDIGRTPVTAVMASSNKCLEGAPGLGFAIVEKTALRAAQGNNPSLSLDLYEQWQGFEKNGQWRFTPPVQVAAALLAALRQLETEGGPEARLRRYRENFDILARGMERLGFRLFLSPADQAPIIATFHYPTTAGFHFPAFYQALAAEGFLIYPGKLSQADTFRIGCIGAIGGDDFRRLLQAIEVIAKDWTNTKSR